MSSISSVSSSSNAYTNASTHRAERQAKMFAKVDTDGSGGVDKTELQSLFTDISKKTGTTLDAEKLFSSMDSNSDGSLSSDELAAGMKSVMPAPPSTLEFAHNRGEKTGKDDLFSKVDSNSDGTVDKAEMTAFTDKMKAETGRDSPISFDTLDTDGDGKLTQTEFDAGRSGAGTQRAGKGGHVEGAGGPPPPGGPTGVQGSASASASTSASFDPLDTNQDGTVSQLERLAGALKDFVSSSDTGSSTATSSSNDAILKLAKLVYEQISAGVSSQSASTVNATA